MVAAATAADAVIHSRLGSADLAAATEVVAEGVEVVAVAEARC
jgi:hypothetical protein